MIEHRFTTAQAESARLVLDWLGDAFGSQPDHVWTGHEVGGVCHEVSGRLGSELADQLLATLEGGRS